MLMKMEIYNVEEPRVTYGSKDGWEKYVPKVIKNCD